MSSEALGWTPVCAIPNVTLEESIEASHAALVPCGDERLRSIADHHPALNRFLSAFRDEFGSKICPTIGMVRQDAPHVSAVRAFGAFPDAVCFSAVVAGQCYAMASGAISGVVHSETFDFYPWFLTPEFDGRIVTVTPALVGMHEVRHLQPQSTAALGKRDLPNSHIDHPMLCAILEHWERCFATGNETVKDRRLFRALEMARAASKMPGGVDATEHHAGRAAALWVSAFEILAHDGRWADFRRVLSLLSELHWLRPKLKAQDREVIYHSRPIQTNLAGVIYDRLYGARNAFLHGNEVSVGTLKLGSGQQAQWFAAPLFRLALTAFLDLRFPETLADNANDQDRGHHIARMREFKRQQKLSEDAILIADAAK